MKLEEFVKRFVCKNTIMRLWKPVKGGHEMIINEDNYEDRETCMEWELLDDKTWHSKYKNNVVVGVTDIVVSPHQEAINIVIKVD